MRWQLAAACEQLGGHLVGEDVGFDGVGTDSRRDCNGQLFVALRGAHHDGHGFVAQAAAQGAAAALVEEALPVALPQCVVADTRVALGRLAAACRDRLPGRVVAITGSNGKTTCKEMVAAILAEVGSVRATVGNLNNDIGLPLTLLGAGEESYLVLEMGANHAGEIAYLTAIARPAAALITGAGRAHLEGFGSLEGVARAKGEIIAGLPAQGTLVAPSESPFLALWRELADGRRVLTFGLDGAADVAADPSQVRTRWDDGGFRTEFEVRHGELRLPIVLPLAGQHNVRNALAAAALTLAAGAPPGAIAAGLARIAPVPGRLAPFSGLAGSRLIDDSYNANPDSVAAAIAVLTALSGRRHLALGDLGELGPEAARLHEEIGQVARAAGVECLHAVGELSAHAVATFGPGGLHYSDQGALIAALRGALGAGDVVLVKGSRAAGMERVVAALRRSES
ncbi:UDP-N-acetylmuramoyl-tripeptide--D-alanyl-D-alanine ligase [Thioflavicoccus mobilis 8321]|uniref:UDP-N-acetylmuramoyl-tripeptide--D-alanyl-D-alanine ligase n=1 Tax=Thioflavicoccus mobilis 8321 TaxID=765912 RepID=L0H2I5_9GAMM|nr:UDP-N-acetylmuramoyl-tripeptide--D-alanyl-D-alanine ligase [Thioflavicoccus mobilis]AGA91799.1 UDP-N-acetylmuramoyl-tripeptide--D-alanyl-D-alanine ligase [Thioflavicoccus mobilis 8321]